MGCGVSPTSFGLAAAVSVSVARFGQSASDESRIDRAPSIRSTRNTVRLQPMTSPHSQRIGTRIDNPFTWPTSNNVRSLNVGQKELFLPPRSSLRLPKPAASHRCSRGFKRSARRRRRQRAPQKVRRMVRCRTEPRPRRVIRRERGPCHLLDPAVVCQLWIMGGSNLLQPAQARRSKGTASSVTALKAYETFAWRENFVGRTPTSG
jgi:hypothetical protein